MTYRRANILAAIIALLFGLQISFAPGLIPGAANGAYAFGRGNFGGGGSHFGGFGGGHFGGFGGGHFGGFSHFGGFGHYGGFPHFGGFGHFGGFHRFGGFHHFGGMHFGRHFGGGHFGAHFGSRHFAGRHFSGRHLYRGHFAHGHFGRATLAAHGLGGTGHFGGRTALAHSALGGHAVGRFNGVGGFDRHGFNRNAFGHTLGWNAWGRNFWGVGWNNWGSGWGYWAGPVFWPFVFGDVLTFALWPDTYYDPFFLYGPDLLLTSIFWPSYAYNPYYNEDYGLFDIYGHAPYVSDYAYYGGHRHHRHHRHYAARSVAQANLDTDSSVALTCAGLAPGVTNLPIDQIEGKIRPTDTQVAMLDDLKTASVKAGDILRSSCPTEVSLTPVGRLEVVAKRIQAVIQAVQIMRPPLTTLYNSLDDEQKGQLAALGNESTRRRDRTTHEETPLSNLCNQQSGSFARLPVQRIEDTIKPTEQQKAAFEALKLASAKAVADLDASCPPDVSAALPARLDAVAKRLDALASAVDTMKPSLTNFFNSLTDEQKMRFNVIGRDVHASVTP